MAARARRSAILNALVVAAVVGWNNWAGVNGLDGRTVGGVSDAYHTRFTPAGYAFSIWGVIFLGLLVNAGYQLWLAFRGLAAEKVPDYRAAFFERLGPWLILTNVANGLWLVLWLTDQIGASVIVLASMLVFLSLAMWRLDMETWDAPREVIFLVWWPIVVYAGWVTVAVLANVSAFLAKHDVVSGDSVPWAIAMIGVATIYNLVLVLKRNLREHAAVAIWAFAAIAVAQWGEGPVQWTALACAAILGLAAGAHAAKNWRSLPFLPRRERPPDPEDG